MACPLNRSWGFSRNNRLIPAGNLDNGNGRFSIKVPSVIENASDLYDLPLISANEAVVTPVT